MRLKCFRHKTYCDIYVDAASITISSLSLVVGAFASPRVIAIFDVSDSVFEPILPTIRYGRKNTTNVVRIAPNRYALCCIKNDLFQWIKSLGIESFDGLFVAEVKDDVAIEKHMYIIDRIANTMVKHGKANITIEVAFEENEIILSLANIKYDANEFMSLLRRAF